MKGETELSHFGELQCAEIEQEYFSSALHYDTMDGQFNYSTNLIPLEG